MAKKTITSKKPEETMNGDALYHEAFDRLWDIPNGLKIKDINGIQLSVPRSQEEGDNATFQFYRVCDEEAKKLARNRGLGARSGKFAAVIAEINDRVDKAIARFENEFGHAPLCRGGYKAHCKRVGLKFFG